MTKRELRFTPEAKRNIDELERTPSKTGVLRQVRKTLGLLETNLRHPSLNTHRFESQDVFEAYEQQHTPGAYRVLFYYGPDRRQGQRRIAVLTIVAITPHP